MRMDRIEEWIKYYDLETGKEVDTAQTYHVGTADLAWYANRQNTMSPGANGKLEFYIIPTRTGAGRTEAEVTIDLDAYQVSKVSDGKAEKSADDTLQNLVDGHILFFENLNNAQGYSKWLYKDGVNKMTVKAPEGWCSKKVCHIRCPYIGYGLSISEILFIIHEMHMVICLLILQITKIIQI